MTSGIVARMFEKLGLAEAEVQAKSSGKYVLIDFTAKWCGPCAKMDRTTWAEEPVHAWVREHAVAIQLDADEHETLCREWNIKTLPSVLVRRDGAELDRIAGYKNAHQLLSWLEGVRQGKTELDSLTESTASTDVSARFQLANVLTSKGEYARALEEFAWLWEHSLEFEPAWVGVRGSFLLSALEPLLEAWPPARTRFEEIRQRSSFSDWLTLSEVLGEDDDIVKRLEALEPSEFSMQDLLSNRRLLEVTEARSAWATLGRLLVEPLEFIRERDATFRKMLNEPSPPELPKDMHRSAMQHLVKSVERLRANCVKALDAAGRAAEARAVEQLELTTTAR